MYWCFVILDGGADYLQILGLKEFQKALGGHSQTMLTKQGRWVVLEMSTVCRFSLITSKEIPSQMVGDQKGAKSCQRSF